MHPKSRDRTGNADLLRRVRKDERQRDGAHAAATGRTTARARRLEALRNRKRA